MRVILFILSLLFLLFLGCSNKMPKHLPPNFEETWGAGPSYAFFSPTVPQFPSKEKDQITKPLPDGGETQTKETKEEGWW